MEWLISFADTIIHLDGYLTTVIATYGSLTYFFLFLIIFLETGVVLAPFLPGDSLIFLSGALAASGSLDILIVFILITVAAIVGDSVNYMIGNLVGKKLLSKGWVKEEHMAKTEKFYQNYGSKTIIIARFVPIVRTIAPFVAGIGKMDYKKFFTFNVAGALCWTTLFLGGGFLFGNIPTVKENLTFVVLVIIIISVIPGVLEIVKARRSK